MKVFLEALLGFPAVVYTVLLGAVMLYWAAALVGAIDLDDDGGGADHVGGESAHGAEHHGGDHGDVGDHDGDFDLVDHDGGLMDLLGAFELRRVPLTVRVSLVVIFGWTVSVLGWITLSPLWPAAAPAWALRALLTLASVLLGIRFAGWAARPLVPVFTPKSAISQTDLAGRDAEVTTGRVDGRFGQVLVSDGGAGLLVDARYEGAEPLRKGARVLVTHWDPDRKVVNVEPLDPASPGVRIEAVTARAEGDVAAAPSGERPAKRRR